MDFRPGPYEVISDVKIRRGHSIVEQSVKGERITNQEGLYKSGTRVEILSTATNPDNSTWGRVSEPDAAGVALWACIKGLNRQYMKPLETEESYLSRRIDALEARVSKLEANQK